VCVCMCVSVCMYVCKCVYVCVCMCVYVCMYVCGCVTDSTSAAATCSVTANKADAMSNSLCTYCIERQAKAVKVRGEGMWGKENGIMD
jgi:spore germination protein YaaH